jgi:hypothetical protein
MAQKKRLLTDISLKGLEIAPSQIRGAVRIVPLIRQNIRNDLRLRDFQKIKYTVYKNDNHSEGKGEAVDSVAFLGCGSCSFLHISTMAETL